ncbi:acyl-CoA dehydrogenase family protein [Arthrobacter sp. zg-Y820]|uniref:acyl-CoA dehydrogenase family protein n=1 Tax=unclassified Arthrobacter TaxID=235627 RepID=UPI001E588D26|nr:MULTISPECIES: acyl-CoA dehydrogenase family protein [unclassified Arthrobacter]MCC9196795.1 acyl-CoA/acyl-ACP dehydrogenase [Arthrobacter sp. zg-Y820]MDK1279657.1 acyl-CoA dehydrogenase family protein [Arthrobacter sp. zg.Y820]WIB07973.1 acyl-CoA dehydrogenase family protein [Arthrobacter sp. zg-Y820]
MKFVLTEEQQALAEAVDEIIESAGGTKAARTWAAGDPASGQALWAQLADLGLLGLCVPEADGGMGGTAVDLVVAFERLGYHAVPGPYIESGALLPDLVGADVRRGIVDGSIIATAAVPGLVPYALDAAASSHHFLVDAESISSATSGPGIASIDRTRTLHELTAAGESAALDPAVVALALDRATLACSAVLLGAGERLLAEAVSYAKIREQFGRAIGEYQGLKHQLADVRIALTFARPLVTGAALNLGDPDSARSISAAKIAAGEAANLAARVALQVHGAIGYTEEHDLGLWITRVRALMGVWGTPRHHYDRIASLLLSPGTSPAPSPVVSPTR